MRAHRAARLALGARGWPATLELSGSLTGFGVTGTFHRWRDGLKSRDDQVLGIRAQRTLRLPDREEVQDDNGDVRTLPGSGAAYPRTVAFIGSGAFTHYPKDVTLVGPATSVVGDRAMWVVRVQTPGGASVLLGLDAKTSLIDETIAGPAGDRTYRDYDDYRVVDGVLVPFIQVDSDGSSATNVTARVTRVRVGQTIDPSVFEPFVANAIRAPSPATVPLLNWQGHIFVQGRVNGRTLTFLVDSGSQGIFIDPSVAQRLGLTPEGTMEVNGAGKARALGVVALGTIDFGSAQLPVRVATVLDISGLEYEGKSIDGVLGYPLFAAAEVRIDPERETVTFARVGTLPPRGKAIAVDTARDLPVVVGQIDRVAAKLVIDTGNNEELLVYPAFLAAHPGLIDYADTRHFAANRGVGGSSEARPTMVDQLQLGQIELYNRYATVILADKGVFGDPRVDGNVGWATLKNLVLTFDLADASLQLDKTRWFDEGRFRSRPP